MRLSRSFAAVGAHENGYKVDIAMTPCTSNFIKRHDTKTDSTHWTTGAKGHTNTNFYEGNHWDITYRP